MALPIVATGAILRGMLVGVNAPPVRAAIQALIPQSVRTGQGLLLRVPGGSLLGRILKRIYGISAATALIEFVIPDSLMGEFGDVFGDVGFGGSTTMGHPGNVIKSWNANGTPFVKLDTGMLGAQKRDGSWKYWRPKKPIVMYAGGANNLKTLLKADAAAERQLRKLKKAIDRRFPQRRQVRAAPQMRALPRAGDVYISESGQGSVRPQ